MIHPQASSTSTVLLERRLLFPYNAQLHVVSVQSLASHVKYKTAVLIFKKQLFGDGLNTAFGFLTNKAISADVTHCRSVIEDN